MCVGIPMQVIECSNFMARCQGRGQERTLNLALVGDQPPGTWLMAFLDSAREILDEQSARLINQALDGLEAAMNGEMDVSRHFADLLDRPPELPAHLRGAE